MHLTATFIFDPNNFDLTYTVELDEESKKVSDELKPVAVNVKVTAWGDPLGVDGENVMWYHISQHTNTYERIVLDENGKGVGTYPVWMATTDDKSLPYSYRIEVVSYETADGTLLPAYDIDNAHTTYATELNRYSAEIVVDGGNVPNGSTLNGAYYENGAQVGSITAIVTIDVFDVTFVPNGGMLNGTTDSTTLNYQIGIPNLDLYVPIREGGYVFDGWYIADENGNITDETAISDTIIFADTTLIAKWKEPLTVKGNVAVAGTYTNDNGETVDIYEHDRIKTAMVLLQKIDANGYAETVNSIEVPVTYSGDYGLGEYEFGGIADDGHAYRIKVLSVNYHTHYLNDTSTAGVTEYDKYTEETEDDMYIAEFLGDTEANVHMYLHFKPDSFDLEYEVDATSIGEGFRPTAAEVFVLCDTGEHIDPQHWAVISQMFVDGEYIGNNTVLENGKGSGSESVWQISPDGQTPYHYSIRVDSLDFEHGKEYADIPYAIYYNGSARYSDINQAQTQLLTATVVPRMYTITFDIGDIPEGVAISGMDEYITMDQTLVDDYYWSYGAEITASPKADGYIFLGWFDEDGNKVALVPADSAANITLTAKWSPEVAFEVMADAGYYSETRNADEKVGVISLNARITNYDSVKEHIDTFGIYIYNSAATEVQASASSVDMDMLAMGEGAYHILVGDIAPDRFANTVLAAPYVVVGGEIIVGPTMTISVATTNKWLGPKSN